MATINFNRRLRCYENCDRRHTVPCFPMLTLALAVWLAAAAAALAQSTNPTTLSATPRFATLPESPAPHPGTTNSVQAVAVSPAASTNAAPTVAPALSGYVPDDKYKLRAGDRVSLQILEDREAPKSLVVADYGELDAPYIGRVLAAGKTCKQLAVELKTQLEKEYYHRATVVLALDAANKFWGRIYVWGQVRNQGPIDVAVNENLTAGKAILRAGGFADFANKKRVKLVRAQAAGAPARPPLELNMVAILEEGKTEQDVALQPDDSIIVPSRLINF